MMRASIDRSVWLRLPGIALLCASLGCSSRDVLHVVDPDVIDPSSLENAAGAEAMRVGALGRLATALASEGTGMLGGLLADEFRSSDTFQQRDETDERRVQSLNALVSPAFRSLHVARASAASALTALRQYAPTPLVRIGEMYFVEGFAELVLAESFCNGVPLSQLVGGEIVVGQPLMNEQLFALALAHLDSALLNTTGDSLGRLTNNAKVLRGRVLLDLKRAPEAGAATASVPTTYRYQVEIGSIVFSLNNSARRYTLVDREGGTGLDFLSARDPRLPWNGPIVRGGFDGNTDLYRQLIWPLSSSFATAVTGVEARLIEAESQLAAGQPAATLATLNALRTTVSGLAPLADPGTADARVNLLFRERAFWLFGTGHRLGDLRRLIRQYARNADAVFPAGVFHKGGTYGGDVNLPVPTDETYNPNFTACLDRKA